MSGRGMFRYDSKFSYNMGKAVDIFYVSILWLVFCIPIVTIGQSTSALYYTVHHNLHHNRQTVWRCFWTAFKSNTKQGILMWLIQLALLAALYFDERITDTVALAGYKLAGGFHYFFYFLLLMVLMWSIITFAYAARFEIGMKDMLKNAAIIAGVHMGWTFVMLLLLLLSVLTVWLSPFFLFALPGGLCWIYEMILERIFERYMTSEDLLNEKMKDEEEKQEKVFG